MTEDTYVADEFPGPLMAVTWAGFVVVLVGPWVLGMLWLVGVL